MSFSACGDQYSGLGCRYNLNQDSLLLRESCCFVVEVDDCGLLIIYFVIERSRLRRDKTGRRCPVQLSIALVRYFSISADVTKSREIFVFFFRTG